MNLILQVFIIYAAAKAAGEICVRLGVPALVGEILIGIAIGPHVLEWVEVNQATVVLSDLGIVVLLFVVGLETRLSDLLAVGRSAGGASLAGMTIAGGGALAVVVAFGYSLRAGGIVAVALAASSVGIAARAFSDLGAIGSRSANIVLGAAVVDDVVTLAALPIVQGLGSGGSVGGILVGLAGAVGFVVLVAVVGSPLARQARGFLAGTRDHRIPFMAALALCLGLAALAEQVGLAALIGAFLAGMVLAETREQWPLEQRMEPLFDLLVPFFFVIAGARMDPGVLPDAGALFLVVLVISTLAAKVTGGAAGAVGQPRSRRLVVGAGLAPRGEVALAVVTAGLAAGDVPAEVFAAVVAVVVVSSLAGPILVKVTLPGARRDARRREGPSEGSGR